MKRSVWSAAIGAGAFCMLVGWWQRGEIAALEEEVGRAVAPVVAGAQPASGAKVTEKKPPTLEDVFEAGKRFGTGPVEAAAMLEALQDRPAEELFGLINEAMAAYEDSRSEAMHFLTALLVVAVTEAEPELALERAGECGNWSEAIKGRAFLTLARRDPAAAAGLLDGIEMVESQRVRATKYLGAELVRSDVDAAMEVFGERQADPLHWALLEGAMAGTAGNPGAREALWRVVEVEEHEVTRTELEMRLLRSAVYGGGLEGGLAAIDRATSVTDKFKEETVVRFVNQAFPRRPDVAYAAMRERLGKKKAARTLAKAVKQWAKRDFNAAGEWLGTVEKTAGTDLAVGAFAEAVAGIDRAAAIEWAGEIVDEGLREEVVGKLRVK